MEAGLGSFVKLEKQNFIGKQALAKQVESGISRKLTGFEMTDRGIARGGYEIRKDGKKAGYVTTGYFAPTLGKNLGLALIDADFSGPGNGIEVVIRGKSVRGVTVETPFYKKKYKK